MRRFRIARKARFRVRSFSSTLTFSGMGKAARFFRQVFLAASCSCNSAEGVLWDLVAIVSEPYFRASRFRIDDILHPIPSFGQAVLFDYLPEMIVIEFVEFKKRHYSLNVFWPTKFCGLRS